MISSSSVSPISTQTKATSISWRPLNDSEHLPPLVIPGLTRDPVQNKNSNSSSSATALKKKIYKIKSQTTRANKISSSSGSVPMFRIFSRFPTFLYSLHYSKDSPTLSSKPWLLVSLSLLRIYQKIVPLSKVASTGFLSFRKIRLILQIIWLILA